MTSKRGEIRLIVCQSADSLIKTPGYQYYLFWRWSAEFELKARLYPMFTNIKEEYLDSLCHE